VVREESADVVLVLGVEAVVEQAGQGPSEDGGVHGFVDGREGHVFLESEV